MRRTLMISVAALALAAASNMTFAQTSKPGGAAGGGTSAPAASPSGAAPGGSSSTVNPTGDSQSTINETTPPGAHKGTQKGAQDMHKGAPDTQKGAQDTTGPQKQKSSQQAPGEKSRTRQSQGEQPRGERREQSQTEPRGERSKQQSQGERSKEQQNNQQSQTERSREQMNQQQSQSPQTGTSKQGAAERPMTSKNVSLTTEQKTTIREKVLTSSAPRVERVDFDIKVGTVVPRTVRIAPLPVTIIEIEPEWRGYMYFVRGDEIIVVEPGTLRIVAVLDV